MDELDKFGKGKRVGTITITKQLEKIEGDKLPDDFVETENEKQLYFRFNLCRNMIQQVSEIEIGTDGRAETLAEYNRQLKLISERIKRLTGKYPPITIKLKPAHLFPIAEDLRKE